MEFGQVPAEELERINFRLPPDHPATATTLRQSTRVPTRFYVGCAKWGRKDWVGTIYPKGTRETDFLHHYAQHFNAIELNATFYRMPSRTQTMSWKSCVGPGFRFCPKISDKISHIKRLKDVGSLTERFLDGISGFGENLGPVFLMLHPQTGPNAIDTIHEFIRFFPQHIRLFVELRNPKWYSDSAAFDRIFELLASTNTGLVITDVAGRRDCLHMRLSTPDAFIRFVGNNLHPTDYERVNQWMDRIQNWVEDGLQSLYFFMHQHEEIYSPQLAGFVAAELNRRCSAGLPVREFSGS